MSLTQEQISRLAKLSALSNDTTVDIDSVLVSLETLAESKQQGVEKFSRSGNTCLRLRADTIEEDATLPDALLACSPERIAAHQIVLAGIMQGE